MNSLDCSIHNLKDYEFCGTLYNKEDLCRKFNIKSNKDSEIILKLIRKLGVPKTLKEINGIFSFVYLDKNNNNLYIARDRFGVVPLYVYKKNDFIAWSTYIKNFIKYDNFDNKIDENLFKRFVTYTYPNDLPFKYVNNLSPASYICINLNNFNMYEETYWDINTARKNSLEKFLHMTISDYSLYTQEVLEACIKRQMNNDDKLGLQLSGGIDSSLIAYLSQKYSKNKLEAFAIIPDDSSISEEKWIDCVADNTSINLNKIKFSTNELLTNLENAVYAYEKNISYPSSLGIYTFTKKAKNKVNILMGGEGADELLYGYSEFSYWKQMIENNMHECFDDAFLINFDKFLDDKTITQIFGSCDDKDLLERRKYLWESCDGDLFAKLQNLHFGEQVGAVLERQFKISLYNSIENRLPFLDNEFVDYSFAVPMNKIFIPSGNDSCLDVNIKTAPVELSTDIKDYYICKWVLKDIATKFFGDAFAYRKKMRMRLPIGKYILNDTFKNYVIDVIRPGIKKRNIYDLNYFDDLYNNITKDDYSTFWQLLMSELWLQLFVDGRLPVSL